MLLRPTETFLVTTTGGVISRTVTMAVSVDTLPLESVAVMVTVLSPRSSQSNSSGVTSIETTSQLSVIEEYTCSGVIEASPLSSRSTVMLRGRITGGVFSITVTVAVPVEALPLTSVTVRVTVLSPTLSQSKSGVSMVMVSISQLSVEPLSICAAVIAACPLASSVTEMFCVTTVGRIRSRTVTVAVVTAVRPA